ncbi:PfkB family carbohydrate kinase [Brachybacterium alimentarium]|uniref:PfkB family carbohydrate kinase n=1 Tax=Brachybacterium alimentarium TaxID=47845 RepID=UPI003FD5400D
MDTADRDAPGFVTIGLYTRDEYLFVDELPLAEQTVSAIFAASSHGGKAANQAVAVALQGVESELVAVVGDDTYGHEAIDSLTGYGVRTGRVRLAEGETGRSVMVVDRRGRQTIVNEVGVGPGLDFSLIEQCLASTPSGSWVSIQSELPGRLNTDICRYVQHSGLRLAFNPSPVTGTLEQIDIVGQADLLVLNEGEARSLLAPGDGPLDCELTDVADRIFERWDPWLLVVTAGAAGAFVRSKDIRASVPSIDVKPVDTSGAGDCFTGTLIGSLLRGDDIVDAVSTATVAAALSTQNRFCYPSYPSVQDIEQARERHAVPGGDG